MIKLIKYIEGKSRSSIKNNTHHIFIGQFMSEPDLDTTFTKKKHSLKRLISNKKEKKLYFDPASRAIYFNNTFFINGVRINVHRSHYNFIKKFFDDKECEFNFCGKFSALEKIFIDLLNDGFIHLHSPKFLI